MEFDVVDFVDFRGEDEAGECDFVQGRHGDGFPLERDVFVEVEDALVQSIIIDVE